MNPSQLTRRTRLTAALVILPLAGGCGLFPDRSLDYREAQLGEPLSVPRDLSEESLESEYIIPTVRGSGAVQQDGDFEIPRPPDLTGQIMEHNYQVSRSGDLSWLIVNEVPGRVWPAISEFLADRGADVAHADPRAGVQQTAVLNRSGRARDWVDVSGMANERPLVLQVRVEHGVQSRSTEVQARLVVVNGAPEERLDWQETVTYPEREQRILEGFADYLQANADTKTYSQVALNLPREERITRQRTGGETQSLTLSLAFSRSWAEVDRALDGLDLAVVDRNRSEKTWYLDLRASDQRSRGWWFWQYQAEPAINAELQLREVADGYELSLQPREEPAQADRIPAVLDNLYETLR